MTRLLTGLPGFLILGARKVRRRLLMALLRPQFKRHGRRFWFDPDSHFSFHTISVGDDVFLGPGTSLNASVSSITLGNKVMFGPGVMVRGGDHNTDVLGRFMADVKEKRPGDDLAVVVEDDVWVGAGAIILKGVRLGRGCIVAAGALVRAAAPPYSVVGGVPARILRWRWTVEEILQHERSLYPADSRLEEGELRRAREPGLGSGGTAAGTSSAGIPPTQTLS
jgi:acetyltransferase-like isoleucine patch superfamily enzyme